MYIYIYNRFANKEKDLMTLHASQIQAKYWKRIPKITQVTRLLQCP